MVIGRVEAGIEACIKAEMLIVVGTKVVTRVVVGVLEPRGSGNIAMEVLWDTGRVIGWGKGEMLRGGCRVEAITGVNLGIIRPGGK